MVDTFAHYDTLGVEPEPNDAQGYASKSHVIYKASQTREIVRYIPVVIEKLRQSPVFGDRVDSERVYEHAARYISGSPDYAAFYMTDPNDDLKIVAMLAGGIYTEPWSYARFVKEDFFVSTGNFGTQQAKALINYFVQWGFNSGAEYATIGQISAYPEKREAAYERLLNACGFKYAGTEYMRSRNEK